MQKVLKRIICTVMLVIMTFTVCGCSTLSAEDCGKHSGNVKCKKCGLNYFDELSNIIKSKATDEKDGVYKVTANITDLETVIQYEEMKAAISCFLIYENASSDVVFMMSMKANTGTEYGWTLYSGSKMAGGTFDAKDLTDLEFKPEAEYNDFTETEFLALEGYYEESVSFCVDMIYSLLSGNSKNLTIFDLGFKNYTPNV